MALPWPNGGIRSHRVFSSFRLQIRFNAQGLRHNLREPGVFCVKETWFLKKYEISNVWNRHEWGDEPNVLV